MNSTVKKLLIAILILIAVKFLISLIVQSPSAFSDEYVFVKMARSFYYYGTFSIEGVASNMRPSIYPILLSPAYALGKMQSAYILMKLINTILSTLIIIPAFLLLKDFLSEKKAFISALIISIIPPFFSFSNYIMAENLFYTLFIFFAFFLYKSLTTEDWKFDILAGIFLGLCFWTKFLGIALFAIPPALILIRLIKKDFLSNKRLITKNLVVFFSAVIVILPWIIITGKIFGYSLPTFLGGYSVEAQGIITHNNYFISFANWFLVYAGYLILASGVILGLLALSGLKNADNKKKVLYAITGLSTLFFIILASNHASGLIQRPIGRYVEAVLPLIMILGFISLEKRDTRKIKKIVWWSIPLFIIASQLMLANLFLMNNLSLSYLGLLPLALNYLFYQKIAYSGFYLYPSIISMLLIISIPFIILYLLRKHKINYRNVSLSLLALFMLMAVLNSFIISVHANTTWNKNEQMQLGKFLDNYAPKQSIVLYDQDYDGNVDYNNEDAVYDRFPNDNTFATMSGFWLNHNLKVGDAANPGDADFIITKKELNYKKLKETSHNIKLYQTS